MIGSLYGRWILARAGSIPILAGLMMMCFFMGIFALVYLGTATICTLTSEKSFDTCLGETMHDETLVREGSHTHWVLDERPHRTLDLIAQGTLVWLSFFVCAWLAGCLLIAPWGSDGSVLLIMSQSLSRYPALSTTIAAAWVISVFAVMILK